MTKSQKALTYQGGCHCGSVRFQVTIRSFDGQNWSDNVAQIGD